MRNYQQDYQNQSYNNQGGFVQMNSSPGRYDPKYAPPTPQQQQTFEYAPQYATDMEERAAARRKTWIITGGCLLCLFILIIIGIILAIVLPRVDGPGPK